MTQIDNQFILGDCFDILPTFPDQSFDAVIMDPPYLTTDLKFDKAGFNIEKICSLIAKKNKLNSQVASFGSIELLGKINLYWNIRWSGVWLKPCPVMRTHSAKKPMSKSELYAVFALPNHEIKNLTFNKIKNYGYSSYTKKQKNQGYKREGKDSLSRMSSAGFTKDNFLCTNDGFRYQTDVIEAPNKRTMKLRERTEHPTQKPVKLIKTLINFITNPNDIILDPFAGSGTLAIACLETGRRYVCIEKEVEYYDIAMRRIEDWHNTPRQQELDLG